MDGVFHADPDPGNVMYLPDNRIALIEMTFSASGSGSVGKANPNTAQTANTTNIPATA